MRVTVLGTGYVGLVSGACLSDFGHEVVCVDKETKKIAALKRGTMPIFEPGLEEVVASNVAARRLFFTTSLKRGVKGARVIIIAVGTPARHGDGFADINFVFAAARQIAPLIAGFTVIVIKSTVPVGAGDEVERIIRSLRPDADLAVVSNPEFLREGTAVRDFKRPDRIVVGTNDERARAVMDELYLPLTPAPLLYTERRTSELIKYAANAFLAMKITFINEISDLCERLGADVQDLAQAIGLDHRIGPHFLQAGPGYGGSCFPKDTLAIVRTAQTAGSPVRLIEAVVSINERRKHAMADRIVASCGGSVADKRIAILGLTFKANTDDMRDAPSLSIIPQLQAAGAEIVAYDPQGMEHARRMLPGVELAPNAYEAVKGADALVVITEWDAFRELDLGRVKLLMRKPNVVDLRNIYLPEEMTKHGFVYDRIGHRGSELTFADEFSGRDIDVGTVRDRLAPLHAKSHETRVRGQRTRRNPRIRLPVEPSSPRPLTAFNGHGALPYLRDEASPAERTDVEPLA